ncbi:MAG: metallophosphoesterase [Oscillospiraceae bacterium]|jgi:predicted phosphodiesterase|nr:metallophosphoesterase [Oscillospiraceae bacterium]
MKRVFAVILIFALLMAMRTLAGAREDKALRFREDGTFKIVQMTDFQDIGLLSPAARHLIENALALERPDLVVLTGDNIANFVPGLPEFLYRIYAKLAIGQFMRIFQRAGVPVAMVYGNHDAQDSLNEEGQWAVYKEYGVFAAPDEYADYRLPILDARGGEKYQLFLLDSHQDAVREEQLDWLAGANNRGVPAIVFQHIVVPEIFDYLVPSGSSPWGYDVPNPSERNYARERPCPPSAEQYHGELAVLRAQGNVQALVFGHDHTNNFVVDAHGVDLVNTASAGFNPFCNGDEDRGVRVFTIKGDGSKYTERTLRYRDICTGPAVDLMNKVNVGESGGIRVVWTYLVAVIYPVLSLFK